MRAAAVAGMLGCAAVLLLTSCAAPPLTLYTLNASQPAPPEVPPGAPTGGSHAAYHAASHGAPHATPHGTSLGAKPVVIAVARMALPDEMDNEDIVFRDGNILRRSQKGRWASRLSVGMTGRLTDLLARRRPAAVVTDRPLTEAPTYRLMINVSRLDVSHTGAATLEADWLIVPANPAQPVRRGRTRFSVNGPVASDQDVVTLVDELTDRLAGAINVGALR